MEEISKKLSEVINVKEFLNSLPLKLKLKLNLKIKIEILAIKNGNFLDIPKKRS